MTGGLLWENCAAVACRCLGRAAELTPLDPRLLGWDAADGPLAAAPMATAAEAAAAAACFCVQGRRVVELGAGTGAGGICAKLLGARQVVLTDLPQHCANIARNCKVAMGHRVIQTPLNTFH